MRFNTWTICVAALLGGLLVSPPPKARAGELTSEQKTELGKFVHDYLLANPEVIKEAIDELDKREKLAEAAGREKALAKQADKLFNSANQAVVGNPDGDVTVMQFYDLNCPYCRAAAHDVDALLKADPKIKLIFVPYAVLSVQSVQGALIELGVANSLKGAQYLDFHRRLYDSRGLIDGQRALAVAKDMGLDPQKVAAAGNTEANLNLLRQNATVGGEMAAVKRYVRGLRAYAPFRGAELKWS